MLFFFILISYFFWKLFPNTHKIWSFEVYIKYILSNSNNKKMQSCFSKVFKSLCQIFINHKCQKCILITIYFNFFLNDFNWIFFSFFYSYLKKNVLSKSYSMFCLLLEFHSFNSFGICLLNIFNICFLFDMNSSFIN